MGGRHSEPQLRCLTARRLLLERINAIEPVELEPIGKEWKTGNRKQEMQNRQLVGFQFPVSCFRFSILFSTLLKTLPIRD